MELCVKGAVIRRIAILAACILFGASCAYPEGNVESLKEYSYWPDGKVRGCTVYDTSGRLKARSYCRNDGTVEKIEKFDDRGNRVQEGLFDHKGNLRSGLDGWAVMKWEYDADSHVRSQISFDELGRPLERRLFSPGGKMIFRQVRDSEKLNPYEEAQMAMYLGGANVKMKNPDE